MKDKETYLKNFNKAFNEAEYASRINQDLSKRNPQEIKQLDQSLVANNDTIGNGFFGHMKDAADAGFFGSLAGTARFGAEFSPFGGEWLNSVADDLDKRVQQNTPLEALTGSDYFAAAVGNALGSGAAGMLEGAVLLGAGSALGTAMIPAGTAVGVYRAMRTTPVLGKLVKATRQMWKSNFGKMQLAEVAGSPIEATAEAGNLITEMRNEGYSDEEIRSAALQSAKYNTAWLTVANMVGGKINNAIGSEGIKAGLKGAVKAGLKGAATEGVGEAVQEYGQSYAHDVAKGVEFNQAEAEEAALQALVGSAFLGGIGNVAKPYINTVNKDDKNTEANSEAPKANAKEDAPEQTQVEVPVAVQNARNVIIDHRETLDEDDPEYGRLTEVLKNGNDEEILDAANAIQGIKPTTKEEVPIEQQASGKEESAPIEKEQPQKVETAPQKPEKTAVPETPAVPATPATPTTPVTPDTPKVPDTPKAPVANEVPKKLETTKAPASSATPSEEASGQESLNEKVAESIKTFKNKRKTDVRNGAQTKSEAVNHFRNYLNKYYVKTKKITPEQLGKLTKEYEDEFDDFNFGEKLTNEEMASVRQNAKNHQIDVLTNIKAGRKNSREELPKMREFVDKLHLSDSDKSALMIEFTNDLKGVIDGLRLQQKKRKGNKNAPIAAVKSVEVQIADIDNKLRKGEAVKPEYIWNVQNNIGKNEDLGIFTKEQADKYLEDLDKVVRDAKQAEINATGGKPEKQETVAKKPEEGKKEEAPKQGNKFSVQPKQQKETNEGDTDKKSLLDKLNQKTKEELEKLKGKTNVNLDEAREELVKPYNIAVAKKQLTPDDVKAVKDRIDQRIEELRAAQQAPSEQFENANAEQTKQEAKPNKFAVQPKNKEQEEAGEKAEAADKEKGKKEEKPPVKPSKFAVEKGGKQEQDENPKPPADKPPVKEPTKEPKQTTPKESEIPPQEDNDTPEVKAAKKKIFDGISKLLGQIGIKLETDPHKMMEAARKIGYQNATVTKEGLVYGYNSAGEGGYVNGLIYHPTNTIYIPKARLSPQVAVHEFTHAWSAIVRANNPVLWERGIKILKRDAKVTWESIKKRYPALKTDDEIASEVISWLSERMFANQLNESLANNNEKPTIKQWIKKYWEALKHHLKVTGKFLGLNNKNIQELKLADFISMPVQALFDAKPLSEIIEEHKKHSKMLAYDQVFRNALSNFKKTAQGQSMRRDFNDDELNTLFKVFNAIGNAETIELVVYTSKRDNVYAVRIANKAIERLSRAQVNAIQYFTKAKKDYSEITEADIQEINLDKIERRVTNTNLVTEFVGSLSAKQQQKLGGAQNIEKVLRGKVDDFVLHKKLQEVYSRDISLTEEDYWEAMYYKLEDAKLSQQQIDIANEYYRYLAKTYRKLHEFLIGSSESDEGGMASFGGDLAIEKAGIPVNDTSGLNSRYSSEESSFSVEDRLRGAVTTVKPTSIKEDVEKAGGKKGWVAKQWRKFYRYWIDKNVDIKDFDEILSNALGRALTAGESIYDKVQSAMSRASGVAHGLIEGDEKHLTAINGEMKRKPMKYIKATLANVLDIVNAEKMNKLAPEYLQKYKFEDWVEAFGTYLGWRRLAEMARLKREAFAEEHAEWAARKRAYDAWVANGRIGDNPQVAAYKEWEAYKKNKRNAKQRWERAGKVGPDPSEEIKAQWLATHKDEEAPARTVGKEPEFKPYDMPEELTEKEVLAAIKDAPAPFAEAANLYYKLNDNILSIMEDAGLISAELHSLLNTKYRDYCPMIRDFSDTAAVDSFVESITSGGQSIANVSSMIQKIRAEGSERTIINPLESTLQTIAAVTNRAERNKAGQHLVHMMTNAPELKGQIRKLQQPRHGTIQADPKNCIFTVMFNGKKVAYQSDPEYYQAIVGYNALTSSLLLRIPQTVARTLRTGATMSPSFIVRNIFRDTITAGIASKNGFIPIIDTIRGAKALWNDPEFRAKFEAAGIVNFNQYGSAESAYRNLTALGSGKNYTVYEPRQIIEGVLKAAFKGNLKEALKTTGISFEQLSSFAESATRAGEFKKALDSGKSMSEAAYDAKEVTLDFTRSGILGQEFNRVIPFFNACIQGGDKMVRLLYNDPKATSLRIGMYIMLPSLALWALNHDEDWYEELEPSIKYTHWCLPNGVRVPKPQEYGILFGGSIEAMLDQAMLKDRRAMEEWAISLKDAISPSILPTIALPLIEWTTNYSFFKGRDLVPQRLQRLPDELQYSTGTSEASKFIGKYTYTSPVKIDNLIRGYTGTMGMFLWQTPDWFAAEKQGLPPKELSEMQFIRDFNVTDATRNRYVNDFYELQQKANQQQAGYGTKGKPSTAVKAIRKAGKVINDLNKDIRTIEMSDKYTPERKRELIDKKRERINNTAKIVVKKYGDDFL